MSKRDFTLTQHMEAVRESSGRPLERDERRYFDRVLAMAVLTVPLTALVNGYVLGVDVLPAVGGGLLNGVAVGFLGLGLRNFPRR